MHGKSIKDAKNQAAKRAIQRLIENGTTN